MNSLCFSEKKNRWNKKIVESRFRLPKCSPLQEKLAEVKKWIISVFSRKKSLILDNKLSLLCLEATSLNPLFLAKMQSSWEKMAEFNQIMIFVVSKKHRWITFFLPKWTPLGGKIAKFKKFRSINYLCFFEKNLAKSKKTNYLYSSRQNVAESCFLLSKCSPLEEKIAEFKKLINYLCLLWKKSLNLKTEVSLLLLEKTSLSRVFLIKLLNLKHELSLFFSRRNRSA